MRAHTFFRRLWRLNAILIALTAAVGLVIGAFGLYHIAKDVFRTRPGTGLAPVQRAPQTTTNGSPRAASAPAHLETGSFNTLDKPDLLWAPVHENLRFQRAYFEKSAENTRNYIIFDTNTRSAHKLLPNDDAILSQAVPLRRRHDGPLLGILAATHATDTTGDGLVSAKDAPQVWLADARGTNLTAIEARALAITGSAVPADDRAILFVRRKEGTFALDLDLKTRSLAGERRIGP
jgi:hypothetical protein